VNLFNKRLGASNKKNFYREPHKRGAKIFTTNPLNIGTA